MSEDGAGRLAVIGMGNPLRGDDGVGLAVVRAVATMADATADGRLPPGVEVVEAPGTLLDHWDLFEASRRVIIVDAVLGGRPPGTAYRIDWTTPEVGAGAGAVAAAAGTAGAEAAGGPADAVQMELTHDYDLTATLSLMHCCGISPRVTVFGVEPKTTDYSLALSPEVAAKVPVLVRAIMACVDAALDAPFDASLAVPQEATGPGRRSAASPWADVCEHAITASIGPASGEGTPLYR